MRIERCTVSRHQLTGDWTDRPAHLPAPGELPPVELITCACSTDTGLSGMGYTYTLGGGGSAVHAFLRDEIAPLLLGRRVADLAALWWTCWRRFAWAGRGGVAALAMAAADIAVWDLRAQRSAQPLHAFIGTHRERVAAYATSVDRGFDVDAALANVRHLRERGHTAFKTKLGSEPLADDLERLTALRELLGDCPLAVDVSKAWRMSDAVPRLAAMASFDVAWVEEPLAPEDVRGHAALQATQRVAVAVGEHLSSPYEFQRYLTAGAASIVQPDVGRVGITGWLAVAQLAEAFHVPVSSHFMQDVSVHLLCAVPNAGPLEVISWLDPFLERPLVVEDGRVAVPELPGHGVAFVEAALAPYLAQHDDVSSTAACR